MSIFDLRPPGMDVPDLPDDLDTLDPRAVGLLLDNLPAAVVAFVGAGNFERAKKAHDAGVRIEAYIAAKQAACDCPECTALRCVRDAKIEAAAVIKIASAVNKPAGPHLH